MKKKPSIKKPLSVIPKGLELGFCVTVPSFIRPGENLSQCMEKLFPLCFLVDTATGKRGHKICDLSDLQ